MGSGYLLDSNVIIDLVGKKLPPRILQLISRSVLFASDISRIEVLGYRNSSEEEQQFNSLFADTLNISLGEEVVRQAILIRKSKKIKLGDAIIAATALVHDLDLLTRNVGDFKGIEDLKVINSHTEND